MKKVVIEMHYEIVRQEFEVTDEEYDLLVHDVITNMHQQMKYDAVRDRLMDDMPEPVLTDYFINGVGEDSIN